jgi:hypothetical protein
MNSSTISCPTRRRRFPHGKPYPASFTAESAETAKRTGVWSRVSDHGPEAGYALALVGTREKWWATFAIAWVISRMSVSV